MLTSIAVTSIPAISSVGIASTAPSSVPVPAIASVPASTTVVNEALAQQPSPNSRVSFKLWVNIGVKDHIATCRCNHQ